MTQPSDQLALIVPDADLPPALQHEVETAKAFAERQHAESTRRMYQRDFEMFSEWCAWRRLSPLPASPAAVATFIAFLAEQGRRVPTIGRKVAAIRYAHACAGLETPTNAEAVKATLRGIRRTIGVAKVQKAPATVERLEAMLRCVPDTLKGKRDRAILLLGFVGAFRRSELSALLVSDMEQVEQGLRVHIRRSKTDQEGEGQTVAVIRGERHCPVEAVDAWLTEATIGAGPVFRPVLKGGRLQPYAITPHSIGKIVKGYAGAAGFDAAEFAGHSLRSGFITSAAERGASIWKLMDVSRHKSVETLRGYIRKTEEFVDHAGRGLL